MGRTESVSPANTMTGCCTVSVRKEQGAVSRRKSFSNPLTLYDCPRASSTSLSKEAGNNTKWVRFPLSVSKFFRVGVRIAILMMPVDDSDNYTCTLTQSVGNGKQKYVCASRCRASSFTKFRTSRTLADADSITRPTLRGCCFLRSCFSHRHGLPPTVPLRMNHPVMSMCNVH